MHLLLTILTTTSVSVTFALALQPIWTADAGGCIRNKRHCKAFNKCCPETAAEVQTTPTKAKAMPINIINSTMTSAKETPTTKSGTQIPIASTTSLIAENGHNKHVCDRIACEARNYEHCYCSTKECYEKPCGNKPIFYANCSDVPGDFGAPDLVCLMDLLHCKCDSHGCGCAIT